MHIFERKNRFKSIIYASYLKILGKEEQNELKANKKINLRAEIAKTFIITK